MSDRSQFKTLLTCVHCQAPGAVVWEENRYASASGPQRQLVALHGEFHQESGRTNSGDPMIVCNQCDQIQPD